ncbi:protein croquemort [Anabrus simplex]|uniref:protein croquemort n=1 Tax=Anabrus simplex TaxID=316456 RepID=UPI0035A31840
MVSTNVKKGLVFGTGSFLVLVGGIIGGFWGEIYDAVLISQLTLTSTSQSYDIWKDIPIPMYMDFYLFNWTNVDEVLSDPTIPPKLEEHGPYVFREYHKRVHLSWNDNDTVTYYQIRTWHFQPEMSKGSLDDEITNINVIATTTAYATRFLPEFMRLFISIFLDKTNSSLVVTKTARELLFDGYDDKLLDFARQLNISLFKIPFKKFGYFAERNGSYTYDGAFNMFTGADSISKLGMLTAWNFEHETHYYGYPCNVVRGSSGELWPPTHTHDGIAIFAPDVCMSLDLTYQQETEVRGISGLHYIGDNRTLDTGALFPDKKCQCVGECQPRGALNVSLCKFNAPIFMTYPHFYLAHPSYLNAVDGLEPTKEKHEFTFAMEPTTGIPLYVNGRLQLNIMVEPFDNISMFQNFSRRMFIPTLWFNQRVVLDEDMADKVKLILGLQTIGMGVLFGLAGIGALLLFVGAMLTIRNGWKGSEGGRLLLENQ